MFTELMSVISIQDINRSIIRKYTVSKAETIPYLVNRKLDGYRIFTDAASSKDSQGHLHNYFDINIDASGKCTLTELQYKDLVTRKQIQDVLTVDNVELLPPSKKVLLLTLRDIQNNVLYLQLDLSKLTNDNAIASLIRTLSSNRELI